MKFERELRKTYVDSMQKIRRCEPALHWPQLLHREKDSDERHLEPESHDPEAANPPNLIQSYHVIFVHDAKCDHIPSTFKMPVNYPALNRAVADPSQ